MSNGEWRHPVEVSRLPVGEVTVSVVLPAHNEAESIELAVREISKELQANEVQFEIVVVDDGSVDGTFDQIVELGRSLPWLRGLRFSRNFGKEAAIMAGLRATRGRAVITMDADLQHPPALIGKMIALWKQGVMVVHAVKEDRANDSVIARLRAAVFNRVLTSLGSIDVRNSSDFKLVDRLVVDILTQGLTERERFFRGLVNWIGFSQASLPFTVAQRAQGEGKWTLLALAALASTAIVSFTTAPLRIVTVLGFVTLVFGALVGADALWSWFNGEAVSGFATTIVTLLILGSFIMISLGIIGEYIAKIYEELKARPLYLIDSVSGFDDEQGKD